jgi:hypothetical protein
MRTASRYAVFLLVALIVSPFTAPLTSCDLADLFPLSGVRPVSAPETALALRGVQVHVIPGAEEASRLKLKELSSDHWPDAPTVRIRLPHVVFGRTPTPRTLRGAVNPVLRL